MAPNLRPLRIGEILDVTIKLYLRNFKTLLLLVTIVAGPLHVLGTLITLSTAPEDTRVTFSDIGNNTTTPQHAPSGSFWTGQLVVIVLTLVVTTLATAVSFKAVSDAYLGERPSVGESLRFVGRRVPSVLWVTVLSWLGIVAAFICLIVPGIWVSIAWTVAVPALLFEGCKGRKALGRSFALVKDRWWPTCAAIVLGYVLASVVGGILQGLIVVPVFGSSDSDSTAIVANGIATTLSAIVVTPFQAALAAVIYYDLRVRKEGFDLQLLAERLGLPVPQTSAASDREASTPADGASKPPFWPPPPGWSPAGK
jgi:hypothetical protein